MKKTEQIHARLTKTGFDLLKKIAEREAEFAAPSTSRALEILIREGARARGIEAAPDGPPIDQADDAPSK